MGLIQHRSNRSTAGDAALAATAAASARELSADVDLDPLLDLVGDARVVMLGEASHGTSDYYLWRARISRRLIREKGFSFIAVEGDWPDCYEVNRFAKGYAGTDGRAEDVLQNFRRWPTWMWANWEVAALANWLRLHNEGLPDEEKAGFYGLDVYSLWESLEAVTTYLESYDPEALQAARRAFLCFEPYREDGQAYARATAFVPSSCEEEVLRLLREVRSRAPGYPDDHEARLSVEQNARAVAGAERYYRTMMIGGAESWNARDEHMIETLSDLLAEGGTDAKAIVWAHNTHVGDARATDMAGAGMTNLGQLGRERFGGSDVVLVGFASHYGSVIAGDYWGAPMERMELPPAPAASWEGVMHAAGLGAALLLTADLPDAADDWREQRAVGVVYDPRRERLGNYVPTRLKSRYDALVYLDRTEALHPLHVPATDAGPPETYPWGV